MKPTLERSSITCKDVGEQSPRKFILVLPEHNVAVRCDDIEVYEGAITGTEAGSKDPLVSASSKVEWIVLREDVAELSTRAAALRRTMENQLAEGDYLKGLLKELDPKHEHHPEDAQGIPAAPQRIPGYL